MINRKGYFMAYVFLIGGLVLLVKGADFFVDGSSSIAKAMKIPSIIIGLTIVAFGTSAPEAAVSIIAGVSGENELALGNAIGSNMFNILAVIGICAMIKPINIQRSVIVKEYPFAILATVAALVLGADIFIGTGDNLLTRSDGIILILFFCVFLYSLIREAMKSRSEMPDPTDGEAPKHPLWKSILFSIGGLAGIIGGGELVVNGAQEIALSFGISQELIGLTIVAIGTSLPELVTSIVAARKGESDIAIGNVIGSNIFNIFFVLSSSAVIAPLPITANNLIDMLILTGVMLLCYFFCITKRKISRVEGAVLAALYVGYMAYIIIR